MYKNQLQELAQRSCFNLPAYACVREGPDHAPRFKASVNFNGEIFESPTYCSTLRQAEHSAAEVALNALSSTGPSRSLTARVLDETGIYKNLLQEIAHRAGLKLPVYTTVRSGPSHVPTFTCTVELATINFPGESAKTKKQAEKNAAIVAWSALKSMPNLDLLARKGETGSNEQDQEVVGKHLSSLRSKEDFNVKHERANRLNQPRRRIGDDSNHIKNCKRWRRFDLLANDSSSCSSPSSDGSSMTQKQVHKSFASLLPPPPPRTTSKILSSTTPPFPSSPGTYSQNSSVCIPPNMRPMALEPAKDRSIIAASVLEEHRKNEEEWLGGTSSGSCSNNEDGFVTKKNQVDIPSSSSSFSSSSSSNYMQRTTLTPRSSIADSVTRKHESATNIVDSVLGSIVNQGSSSASTISSTTTTCSRARNVSLYTGVGFDLRPYRMAPAVQIRTVIPVCATPPPPHSDAMSRSGSSNSRSSTSSSTRVSKAVTPEAMVATAPSHQDSITMQFDKKLQL